MELDDSKLWYDIFRSPKVTKLYFGGWEALLKYTVFYKIKILDTDKVFESRKRLKSTDFNWLWTFVNITFNLSKFPNKPVGLGT